MSCQLNMDPRYFSENGIYARIKQAEAVRQLHLQVDPTMDDNSSSEDDDEDDYADVYVHTVSSVETSADYDQMRKLCRFLREGAPILAKLALVCMRICGLESPGAIQALKDHNSINMMINLLECDYTQVQIASLRCLKLLSRTKMIRYEIVYYGGLETLVTLLWQRYLQVRKEAAETITLIAVHRRAWRIVRKYCGIQFLTNMIDVPRRILQKRPEKLRKNEMQLVESATVACGALQALCGYENNRKALWSSGTFHICRKILAGQHTELIIACLTLIQQCAVEEPIIVEFRESGLLQGLRKPLFSNHQGLMQASAQTLFRCAQDYHSRELFGEKGYVEKMCNILSTSEYHSDAKLMASITGGLWKCAKSRSNAEILHSQNIVQLLTQLIQSQPLEVQVHIVGCLAILIKNPKSLAVARKNGFIEITAGLMNTFHPPLIKNLNKAIAEASKDPESMAAMEKHDIIRLVWSHLKNEDLSVISNTAWKLHSILTNVKDTDVHLRTLLGGLQLIIDPLTSIYTSILTPICAIISELADDAGNVPMLSDFHIVYYLSKLKNTRCKRLRYYLCMSIARCCQYRQNRQEFAERGVLPHLLKFIKSKTPMVRGAACHALYQMSLLPKCCAVIHRTKGIVRVLASLMDSSDTSVQVQAAGTLLNIRYFSMFREKTCPKFMERRLVHIERGFLKY